MCRGVCGACVRVVRHGSCGVYVVCGLCREMSVACVVRVVCGVCGRV